MNKQFRCRNAMKGGIGKVQIKYLFGVFSRGGNFNAYATNKYIILYSLHSLHVI